MSPGTSLAGGPGGAPAGPAGGPAGAGGGPGGGGGPVLGVGVDLCDVDRLRQAMARTRGLRDRVFTAEEQAYCERRRDPAERYAARFAAKEAVLKAMGVGLGACPLREIEVELASSGAPGVALHGTASGLAADRGVRDWRLSLTHTRLLAQATALAIG